MSQIVWRSSSLKRLHTCTPPDRRQSLFANQAGVAMTA
jgi:hypothetical protein